MVFIVLLDIMVYFKNYTSVNYILSLMPLIPSPSSLIKQVKVLQLKYLERPRLNPPTQPRSSMGDFGLVILLCHKVIYANKRVEERILYRVPTAPRKIGIKCREVTLKYLK